MDSEWLGTECYRQGKCGVRAAGTLLPAIFLEWKNKVYTFIHVFQPLGCVWLV